MIRKFYDQNGILGGKTDKGNEADLEKDVMSMPTSHTAHKAPKTPKGTAKITAKGTDQLSYCAASTRNTMRRPNAKATMDWLPT